MKKILFGAFCLASLAVSALTPEQSGGIYYAYPYTTDSLAPVPAGFEPVYMSHYGRHGSRWAIDFSMYEFVSDELEKAADEGNLTEAGRRLMPLVHECWVNAYGHSGELAPLGSRQHKAIAGRMASRFPTLFETSDSVVMRSSTVPRCIISMSAFSEALREMTPGLRISRAASPCDMKFINHSNSDARKMGEESGEWMQNTFYPLRNTLTGRTGVAGRIFNDPSKVENPGRVVRNLHDIAIAIQNVDGLSPETSDIFNVFTPDDIETLWQISNYMMCMRHSNATPGSAYGPASAGNLLRDIIDRADAALASGAVSADLRFGHDTALIRLLSLAGLEGCSPVGVSTPDEVARAWRSYEISPMGANLQMPFFRNERGEIITGLRLNERPVAVVGLEPFAPGYYRWEDLKTYWNKRIDTIVYE